LASAKLFQATGRDAGVITWVQFWKARPIKFGRANKTSKIRCDFRATFDFETDQQIENRRSTLSTIHPSHVGRKKLVSVGPQTK